MQRWPSRPSLTVASLLLLAAAPALAQHCSERACTATNTVSVHVGTVLRLGVQGSTTVLATAGQGTLASGEGVGVGPTAVVRSNGTWRLQVSTAQDAWTPVGGAARSDKHARDRRVHEHEHHARRRSAGRPDERRNAPALLPHTVHSGERRSGDVLVDGAAHARGSVSRRAARFTGR